MTGNKEIGLAEQKKALEVYMAIKKITESGCEAEIRQINGKYKIMKIRKNIEREVATI